MGSHLSRAATYNALWHVCEDGNANAFILTPTHAHIMHQGSNGDHVSIIPRYATNIYFDCSLPEENEKQFNSFYGPKCLGFDHQGPADPSANLKCNATSFKYDHDLSIEEIADLQGARVCVSLRAGCRAGARAGKDQDAH